MIQCSEQGGALVFSVRVVPRASRSSVMGEHDGALRVRIRAAPVDGAANEELVDVLARALDLPARDVKITSGHTSKLKKMRVTGLTRERLQSLMESNQERSTGSKAKGDGLRSLVRSDIK